MKVQVCFDIEEEQYVEAIRRIAELVQGAAEEEELEPLLSALQDPSTTVFEVEEEIYD